MFEAPRSYVTFPKLMVLGNFIGVVVRHGKKYKKLLDLLVSAEKIVSHMYKEQVEAESQ